MPRIAAVLAFALGALLSGCFASDRPMFRPDTALRALGDGGRYATFETDNGTEKSSDPIVVRPRQDGGYDFVNENGAATPVTFHAIPGGLHVAQIKLEGDQGYGYVLVRVAGSEMVVIPAECDNQDKAAMHALGVEQRTRYECRIDKVSDPTAFFTQLRKSEPVSRMARE
jgi:hypothetical protein